jgi:methionine-S-sulfoxide reductase
MTRLAHVGTLLVLLLAATLASAGVTVSPRTGRWCKKVKTFAKIEEPVPSKCTVAILSGGSFLQLAKSMQATPGLYGIIKGYTGGYARGNVTYEDVCNGRTGHAEAVMVAYDAAKTNFTDVLNLFFDKHDATVAGAMMATIGDETYYGSQYRSVVYVRQVSERKQFVKVLKALKMRGAIAAGDNETKHHNDTIVTRGLRFDGTFLPELSTDEELLAIRKRIIPDPTLRDRYVMKMRKTALVADPSMQQQQQQQAAAGGSTSADDALAREFARMDREGKLAGAAVRSSKKAWQLVRDGTVNPKHPDSAESLDAAAERAEKKKLKKQAKRKAAEEEGVAQPDAVARGNATAAATTSGGETPAATKAADQGTVIGNASEPVVPPPATTAMQQQKAAALDSANNATTVAATPA